MEIWDKQPGESQKAYAWFCRYRDYGVDRSIAKVLQKYIGKASSAVLSRWSVKYDWVKRAETYDEYLEKERRKEYEAHNLEMGKRHIQQARALQEKAMIRIQQLDPAEMTPTELLRFLDLGMKIEKDSLPTSDDLASVKVDRDVIISHRLSGDLLARADRLLQRKFDPEDSQEKQI